MKETDMYADLCGQGRPEGMTTEEGMKLCCQYIKEESTLKSRTVYC